MEKEPRSITGSVANRYPAEPFRLTEAQTQHLAEGLAEIALAYVARPENRERFRRWQMERYGDVLEYPQSR